MNQSDGIFLCDYFDSVRLCRRTTTDEPTGPFEEYGYSIESHYRGAMAAGDGAGSKSQKCGFVHKGSELAAAVFDDISTFRRNSNGTYRHEK